MSENDEKAKENVQHYLAEAFLCGLLLSRDGDRERVLNSLGPDDLTFSRTRVIFEAVKRNDSSTFDDVRSAVGTMGIRLVTGRSLLETACLTIREMSREKTLDRLMEQAKEAADWNHYNVASERLREAGQIATQMAKDRHEGKNGAGK